MTSRCGSEERRVWNANRIEGFPVLEGRMSSAQSTSASPDEPFESAPRRPASDSAVPDIPLVRTPSRWPWPTTDPSPVPADLSGGLRGYSRKLGRYVGPALIGGAVVSSIQEVTGAIFPATIGRAIDAVAAHGFGGVFAAAMGVLLAVLVLNIAAISIGEIFESNTWDRAAQESVRSSGRSLSLRGRLVKRRLAAGDVVTSLGDDGLVVGEFVAWLPSLIASVFGIAVVSTLMLRTSVALGLVVLIGVPIALSLSLLLAPKLESLQSGVREAEGRLSTITTDAVAGLRILRGVGGESRFIDHYRVRSADVRDRAIRLAATTSALSAISEAAPVVLTGVVIIYGAHLVGVGALTVGGLVAFYGFMNYVGSPMRVVLRSLETFIRARVAARKIVSVIDAADEAGAERPIGGGDRASGIDWAGDDLVDEPSGLRIRAGRLTGVVCASVDAASEIAGRFGAVNGARGASIGRAALADVDPVESRRRLVLVSAVQHLFEGTLRGAVLGRFAQVAPARDHATIVRAEAVDPTSAGAPAPDVDRSRDEEVLAALAAADARDVLGSLPGGLDGVLTEKGRNLSGGQRQRVALARALFADPEVLVLVDPTSALDAHTEVRIGRNLARVRAGRTTVVFTSSPLLLDRCDEVVAIGADGRVSGRGEDR